MSDLPARIGQALQGVTPGPWTWGHDTPAWTTVPHARLGGRDDIATVIRDEDADFIAAARDLLPACRDRITALETENARAADEVGRLRSISALWQEADDRITALETALAGLCDAYYAAVPDEVLSTLRALGGKTRYDAARALLAGEGEPG